MSGFRTTIDRFPSWIFTVLTVLLILWLTLARKPLGEMHVELFYGADKVVHALMFGWLAAMIILDYSRSRCWSCPAMSVIFTAVTVSSLFGVFIEFLQERMHNGRTFDIEDIVADFSGAVIAGGIWLLLRTRYDGGR